LGHEKLSTDTEKIGRRSPLPLAQFGPRRRCRLPPRIANVTMERRRGFGNAPAASFSDSEEDFEGTETAGSYRSSSGVIVTSRALFGAVAAGDHRLLLELYAANAHSALLRHKSLQERWSSWVPSNSSFSGGGRSAAVRRSGKQGSITTPALSQIWTGSAPRWTVWQAAHPPRKISPSPCSPSEPRRPLSSPRPRQS
jgi:hypothetical protein